MNPETNDLLFERFVSQEGREPPDIDVDFEHERREIIMQWVFNTYGRDRAALRSNVIRYRAGCTARCWQIVAGESTIAAIGKQRTSRIEVAPAMPRIPHIACQCPPQSSFSGMLQLEACGHVQH